MSDISFKIFGSLLRDVATRRAAIEALNLCDDHLASIVRADATLEIIATDAQFGKFIALRCIYGCSSNVIQALSPKLICDPRPCPQPTLVTKVDVRR